MEDALPLPSYDFSPNLSEDENYLILAVILARNSTSRKGHMGALIVANSPNSVPKTVRDLLARSQTPSTILSYGVNMPLLFHTHAKSVPEIHAEAYCVASAARRGVSIQSSTCYVTFPPCNDCFKILVAAGVKRIVYRKFLDPGLADAVIVAAEACGVQLVGTGLRFARDPRGLPDAEEWQGDVEALLDVPMEGLTSSQMDRLEAHINEKERKTDAEREDRARLFWTESSSETRARVDTWWERFHTNYRSAAKRLQAQHRGGFMRTQQKISREASSINTGI